MPTRYLRLGPREQDTGSDDTSRRTEQDEEEFWPKLDKKTADRIGILNRWIYPVCRSVVTKEGDRTVAVVIVGLGADMPFAKRQSRLAALKSLDLAFLVTTEHHSLLGRIEVKTDDIPELRLKVWIGGKLKDPRQVRLDFVVTPDPLHGRLGDSQLAGHRAASPSRPAPRWPRGLVHDLAQDLRAKPAFAARARLIPPRPKPPRDIPPSPLCA